MGMNMLVRHSVSSEFDSQCSSPSPITNHQSFNKSLSLYPSLSLSPTPIIHFAIVIAVLCYCHALPLPLLLFLSPCHMLAQSSLQFSIASVSDKMHAEHDVSLHINQ